MSELKLFTVTLETEIVVLAKDIKSADDEARKVLQDMYAEDYSVFVTPLRFLPDKWTLNAIPFGERDEEEPDRTVGEWLEEGAAPEFVQQLRTPTGDNE